ncbi:MAG: hypothetical protein IJ680_02840 [Paludibacteraceae bacterium]|nr:hypothetical protein [Paludibacteraceae bacterium]
MPAGVLSRWDMPGVNPWRHVEPAGDDRAESVWRGVYGGDTVADSMLRVASGSAASAKGIGLHVSGVARGACCVAVSRSAVCAA